MATSVVYSAIFGAVLGSIRSVRTSLVLFDTEVVDLTDRLADPVDVLFGTQLGGGTDIDRAVAYCQGLVTRRRTRSSSSSRTSTRAGCATRCSRAWPGCSTTGSRWSSCSPCPTTGRRPSTGPSPATSPAGGAGLRVHPDAFPDLLAVALVRQDVGAWAVRAGADRRHVGRG